MMDFLGTGIKMSALLELVEELKSYFGEKYKVGHGLTFVNI